MPMSYKKYLYIKLPFSVLFSVFLIIIFMSIFNSKFNDTQLDSKKYLLGQNPSVFFAGDSRAERHLDPIYYAELSGLQKDEVANIAVSSGSILSVAEIVKKYPEKFKESTLIISVSSNQINDNAVQLGYYPDIMISKLNVLQQIKTFFPNDLPALTHYYEKQIKYFAGLKSPLPEKQYVDANGFFAVDKENINLEKIEILNHPWYENWEIRHVKEKMINDAVHFLKPRVKNLIIYSAPIAKGYLAVNNHIEIFKYENEFNNIMKKICEKEGVSFFIFSEYDDGYFYDGVHLNKRGAEKFTKNMYEIINKMYK